MLILHEVLSAHNYFFMIAVVLRCALLLLGVQNQPLQDQGLPASARVGYAHSILANILNWTSGGGSHEAAWQTS